MYEDALYNAFVALYPCQGAAMAVMVMDKDKMGSIMISKHEWEENKEESQRRALIAIRLANFLQQT